VVGILGGLIIGVTYLQLSPVSFMNEVFKVLVLRDIVISMAKSVMFAWVIVIIGSYYGFHVKGGAEGVGRATTNSVVASIFAIILLDAIFSLIFYF
jgi:phospholipid/cholesterol/gamma-HCH transport system permease protein